MAEIIATDHHVEKESGSPTATNVTSSSKWVGEPDQMGTCALDRLPMELLLNILAPKFNLYLESSLFVLTHVIWYCHYLFHDLPP